MKEITQVPFTVIVNNWHPLGWMTEEPKGADKNLYTRARVVDPKVAKQVNPAWTAFSYIWIRHSNKDHEKRVDGWIKTAKLEKAWGVELVKDVDARSILEEGSFVFTIVDINNNNKPAIVLNRKSGGAYIMQNADGSIDYEEMTIEQIISSLDRLFGKNNWKRIRWAVDRTPDDEEDDDN